MFFVDLASECRWSVGSMAPGTFLEPRDVELVTDWVPAVVPGTVASARLAGVDVRGDTSSGGFEDRDWVFKTTFDAAPAASGACRVLLDAEGLATISEVWINGVKVLESRSMFRSHTIDVSHLVASTNELLLVFRALNPVLAEKRPRPRWKTKLVESQNLRFVRTTLLGRMVSWTPKVEPVGPWRPVRVRALYPGQVEAFTHRTSVAAKTGQAVFSGTVWAPIDDATVEVVVADTRYPARTTRRGEHLDFEVTACVESPPLWWPHSHGPRGGLDFVLHVDGRAQRTGTLRFRTVELNRDDGKVEFVVNGTPVFVRGACWTVSDIKSLQNEPTRLRTLLEAAKDLGLNMLRVGGTMTYEDDAFYAACDELGILVWQEFMFANMDYPFAEPSFRQEVTHEVVEVLRRAARYGSVVAFCGGSEVEQQAAMVGLPREDWSNEFFAEELPRLCAQHHGQAVYFPSSPSGGDLPFHPSQGIAHYYGVGAYQRDISDLAVARVKFASECLAFANVPASRSLQAFFGTSSPAPHLPAWKAGVHRDNGSGWDFEDVRDHYTKTVFGVDPIALRYSNLERYIALSSVVSGELMAQVFTAWRNPENACSGGLIWFFNDLVPGAGWGLVDAAGVVKPAAHVLKQTLAPLQTLLEDRGLEGHSVCLLNETTQPCTGKLIVELWHQGRTCTARAEREVRVPARGHFACNVDALLGHFLDTTWSYRFGPCKHEAVTARWLDTDGHLVSQAVRFVGGGTGAWVEQCEVQTTFGEHDGQPFVDVKTDALLHYAHLDLRDCAPIDDYVHLVPGQSYRFRFSKPQGTTRLRGDLTALNYAQSHRIASAQ